MSADVLGQLFVWTLIVTAAVAWLVRPGTQAHALGYRKAVWLVGLTLSVILLVVGVSNMEPNQYRDGYCDDGTEWVPCSAQRVSP